MAPALLPLLIVVACVNAIAVCINVTFLLVNRLTLTTTQKLAPLLLVSSTLQCARAVVLAALGFTETAVIIFNVCAVVGEIMGFSYFVGYVLILVNQAHVVANQPPSTKKQYAMYSIHGVFVLIALAEMVLNNVLHHNFVTGIKSLYCLLELTVISPGFVYSGVKLIRFANENTKMIQQLGGASATTTSLKALKKSLYILLLVCIVGFVVYSVQTITMFRTREVVPRLVFAPLDIAMVVCLMVLNFVISLHAWLYLDSCKRKTGRDPRRTPMATQRKTTRNSLQVPTKPSRESSTSRGQQNTGAVPDREPNPQVEMVTVESSGDVEQSQNKEWEVIVTDADDPSPPASQEQPE
jgi:hypothetical protein